MHEFSLCRSVIDIAERYLKQNDYNSKRTVRIIVKIGELAGVDIESFEFWFPVAAKESVLEQAKLEIIHEQAIAKCKDMLVESIIFN